MNTSHWSPEMQKWHLEIEIEAKRQRRIATYNGIRRAIILSIVITTGLLGTFKYGDYLTSNIFLTDLKSSFSRYFNQDISDALAEFFDFIISLTCAICMLYTFYLFGFFHLIGSVNANYSNAKYGNITSVIDYRNGLMAAKSPDAALDILVKTSGMDALASGTIAGKNIESTTRYLDGLMGAKSYPDALKMFTDKK
jgi:hypothetical protein